MTLKISFILWFLSLSGAVACNHYLNSPQCTYYYPLIAGLSFIMYGKRICLINMLYQQKFERMIISQMPLEHFDFTRSFFVYPPTFSVCNFWLWNGTKEVFCVIHLQIFVQPPYPKLLSGKVVEIIPHEYIMPFEFREIRNNKMNIVQFISIIFLHSFLYFFA